MQVALKLALLLAVALVIELAARRGRDEVAGLVTMVPVALLALILAVGTSDATRLQAAVRESLIALPVFIAFAASLYGLLQLLSPLLACALSSAVWLGAAAAFLVLRTP